MRAYYENVRHLQAKRVYTKCEKQRQRFKGSDTHDRSRTKEEEFYQKRKA